MLKLEQKSAYQLAILLIILISFGVSVASLMGQYVFKMNPCVMCIQQRLAMMATCVIASIFYFFNINKLAPKLLSGLGVLAAAGFGLKIAIEQIMLQNMPLDQQPSCGAPWTFRLRGAPLFDLYEPIIRGTGVCGEVINVMGVSLPVWSSILFSLMILVLLIGLLGQFLMPNLKANKIKP